MVIMLDEFEKKIRKYAIYNPKDRLNIAPISKLFAKENLEYLASGTSSRVFKVKNTNWVLKEGRWDLDIDVIGKFKLKIPVQPIEMLLNQFNMYFLPTQNQIKEQYFRYLKLVNYLGYFETESDFYHEKIESIIATQRRIRTSLYDELEVLDISINQVQKLKELFKNGFHNNYLQPEYLLYGDSITENNKQTYFILQKYTEGVTLHDSHLWKNKDKYRKDIIELCLLMLYLDKMEGLMPDTRPKYMMFESYDWLGKTENIIITNDNKLKLIDTRLIWDKNDNWIKRGLIIPSITTKGIKAYLKKLL